MSRLVHGHNSSKQSYTQYFFHPSLLSQETPSTDRSTSEEQVFLNMQTAAKALMALQEEGSFLPSMDKCSKL